MEVCFRFLSGHCRKRLANFVRFNHNWGRNQVADPADGLNLRSFPGLTPVARKNSGNQRKETDFMKSQRVDTWAASIPDRTGALAAKLKSLARGINGGDGKGVVFVTPIKGAKQVGRGAAGFTKTASLHTLRAEGPDKVGQAGRVATALASHGLNLRGLSASRDWQEIHLPHRPGYRGRCGQSRAGSPRALIRTTRWKSHLGNLGSASFHSLVAADVRRRKSSGTATVRLVTSAATNFETSSRSPGIRLAQCGAGGGLLPGGLVAVCFPTAQSGDLVARPCWLAVSGRRDCL